MREHDRGQSELLGFALIFAFIVFTIALLSATGFTGLDDAQDHQRTTNAEQAFTALAENVDDVTRRGAPGRSTEISLADASLSIGEPEEVTVTVGEETPGNTTVVETEPIVYDSGSGTTIAYSNGAVIRQDGDRSVMLRQPNFRLSADLVHLPIVSTSTTGDGSVGGTSAVGVETRRTGSEVLLTDDSASNVTVTITVTSDRVESWARYLDTETAADCGAPLDDTVSCEIETRRVYLTVEHLDVRLE